METFNYQPPARTVRWPTTVPVIPISDVRVGPHHQCALSPPKIGATAQEFWPTIPSYFWLVRGASTVVENPHGLHWNTTRFSANARQILWSRTIGSPQTGQGISMGPSSIIPTISSAVSGCSIDPGQWTERHALRLQTHPKRIRLYIGGRILEKKSSWPTPPLRPSPTTAARRRALRKIKEQRPLPKKISAQLIYIKECLAECPTVFLSWQELPICGGLRPPFLSSLRSGPPF
jgi:hypothetical protein